MKNLKKEEFLGVGITNARRDEVLEYVKHLLQKTDRNFYITTPNPEMLVFANKQNRFKTILNNAEIALPDGRGIELFSPFLGIHFNERISGTDFMELLCKESVKWHASIGLLGAKEGIADKVADRLRKKYPGINIVYISEEWMESVERSKIQDSRFEKNKKFMNHESTFWDGNIDILFVAFGHPKQEEWMSEHLEKYPVRVMMGVGGAFDYISGTLPRAPKVVRQVGFEWLFRLVRQPQRFKRVIWTALIEYTFLVLRYRLKKEYRENPPK